MISLKQVSIGYQKPIFSEIDLEFKAQRIYALVGLNGAGKSTLLKTIAGIIPSISGAIFIEEKNIESFSVSERANKISWLGKIHTPFYELTVRDFLQQAAFDAADIFLKKEMNDVILKASLEKVQLNISLDAPLYTLSDGMKQKVYLAQILLKNTPIILLDEPLAHLDIKAMHEIASLLQELSSEKTILYSVHDISVATEYSSEQVFIQKDKIKMGTYTSSEIVNYFLKT